MRAINNPEVLERTAVRADVGAVAIALIGYLLITSVATIIMMLFTSLKLNGAIYPAASGVGLAFILFILRGNLHAREIFEETREMPGRVMRNAVFCVAGLQPIFMFVGQGITTLFENAGYMIDLSSFDPQAEGVVFIIINLVVAKPIIEGILFRGAVLRVLSAYGRTFAIAASAILFGLYQGNLLQIGYAFCAGLILGYITFRYSIKYSIILHAVHNGLMVGVSYLSMHVAGFAIYGLWTVCLVGLVVVAIKKGAKVKRFLDRGRARANAWKHTFGVPALLLYIAITIVITAVQMDVKEIGTESKYPTALVPKEWGFND
ncbi:MAG: CPBP family intramembrane metalloprotease [Clostridiales Family XIII bacterium]|jgi:membrane protease YdiL (CAAX protease family)|nr:CPBP family intramembrane metalloprotease [Clostridiales Family XIII bacterium]